MPTQQDVSKHYTHGNLVAAIQGGIESDQVRYCG
jgi:hypothetical protein